MTERGLLLPTRDELRICEREMTVAATDLPPASFPGWQDVVKRYSEILLTELVVERQTINDCQGNAIATGEEARQRLLTGKMVQLARTYAYNASEYLSGPNNVGRDQGTSIQSGVRLMTKGIEVLILLPDCQQKKRGVTGRMNAMRHDLQSEHAALLSFRAA